MGGIFVSYRRKDSAGHAGRLFDRLVDHFGKHRVFRDVDHLRPGDDFVESLARAVGSCDAFILVIGRDWLDARDERGARRLEDPEDFIRIELETALRRKVLLLPVLVEGAKMMEPSELPEPLRPLARRQAIELSEHRWDFDVQELLQRLEEVVKPKRSIWKTPAFRISAAVVLLAAIAFGTRSYWLPGNRPTSTETGSQTPAKPDSPRENLASAKGSGGESKSDKSKSTPTQPADPSPPRGTQTRPSTPAPPPPAVAGAAGRPTALPLFVDKSFRDVSELLKTLGLNSKVEFNSTGTKPAGIVFGQNPSAGSLLAGVKSVHLYVEAALRPEEHAAGFVYLSLSEVFMLDRDDNDVREAWDVGFDRAGTNLVLEFGTGATAVRLSPAASNASRVDANQCRAVTATWSNRNILIPQTLTNSMDVCVRTTKGRLALLRLEELTPEPELRLRYSTLR